MTRTEPQDLAGMVPARSRGMSAPAGPGRDRPGDPHGWGDAGGPTGEVPPVAGEVIFRTGVANY
jgi:hypothetical protein